MISIVPSLPNPVLVEQANVSGGSGSQGGSTSSQTPDATASYQTQMQNHHGRNGAEGGVPPRGSGGSEFQDARNAYSTQGNGGSNGHIGGAPPPNSNVTGGNSEFQDAKNDYTVAGSGNVNGGAPPPPAAPPHNSEASLISISDVAKELVSTNSTASADAVPAEAASKSKTDTKAGVSPTPVQPDSSSQAVLLAMSQLTPSTPAAVQVKQEPAPTKTADTTAALDKSKPVTTADQPAQSEVPITQLVTGSDAQPAGIAAQVTTNAATQSTSKAAPSNVDVPADVSTNAATQSTSKAAPSAPNTATSVAHTPNLLAPKPSLVGTTTNPILPREGTTSAVSVHADAVVVSNPTVQASNPATASGKLSEIQRMQALTGSSSQSTAPAAAETANVSPVQSVAVVPPAASATPIKVQVAQDTKGLGSSTVTDTLLGTGVTVVEAAQSKSETGNSGSNGKQSSQPETPVPSTSTGNNNLVNAVGGTATLTPSNAVNGVTAVPPVPNSDQMKIINQISAHVDQLRAQSGGGIVTIHLNPSDLGSVQITMSQTKDGIVAHMIASSDTARQALQSGNHTLNASLEQKGLKLQSLNVDLNGAGGNAMNYQNPQHQAALHQQPVQQYRTMNSQITSADTAAEVSMSAVQPLTNNSLLDYRV